MSGAAPSATFDGLEAMGGTEAARESVSTRPSAARELERGLILRIQISLSNRIFFETCARV